MKYALIITAALLVGYVLLAARMKLWPWSGKVVGVIRDNRQQAIIESLRVMDNGPGFPTVWSAGGISQDVQGGIEDAFTERIATAKAMGWMAGLDPRGYTIYIFPSVRDTDPDGNYSPVFQVFLPPGDPYIGSEYDRGGWIYATEQCLTDGNGNLNNKFVIAQNNSRAYTARATSYALDHLFAYHNDRALYERTKDHSGGVLE